MSHSDTSSASSIVRQTRLEYEEMRRRLAETERKLNKLAKLESEDPASTIGKGIHQQTQRHKNRDMNEPPVLSLNGDSCHPVPSSSLDDVTSVRSEMSTVPGSYTGFASRPFPASTPCKKECKTGEQEDNYDSDSSGGSQQAQKNSLKLLRQNQRLLSEVERLVCELQTARQHEGELTLKVETCQTHMAELEDKVEGLLAETEAQDKALRAAEQHLLESQKQVNSLQQNMLSCKQEIQELCTEKKEEQQLRAAVETQRDEAVHNFLETQESLEKYQRQTHERIRMLEDSEDHLRDSLQHANMERDELLQQVEVLQASMTKHEQEIERLQVLGVVEQETREGLESQNLELQQQLAKVTVNLKKCEEEASEMMVLRQENAALKLEVEEGQAVLDQLEEMSHQLRRLRMAQQHAENLNSLTDDSGNFSIHLGNSFHSSPTLNATTAKKTRKTKNSHQQLKVEMAGNTNNNGVTISSILAELRSMLFDMDEEIRRLRNRLSCHQEEEHALRDLRTELIQLMEKAKHGEEQTQEMEKMIGCLEIDKAKLAHHIEGLQEELSNRDSQILVLDSRFSQRNTQIIELQEELSRKNAEIIKLEKELWKKSSQISHAETMLEAKCAEIADCMNNLSKQQHDSALKEEHTAVVKQRLNAVQKELEHTKASEQLCQSMHATQCHQYENQIEALRKEIEKKEFHFHELQQKAQNFFRECQEKEHLIHQLETTLLEAKNEINVTAKLGQEKVQQMEGRLCQSNEQVNQLESALLLCRNEIKEHIHTMERTKQHFDTELSAREQAMIRLEDHLKEVKREIKHRCEENIRLQHEVLEKSSALQQYSARVSQLEQSESVQRSAVSQLEQQLLREKAQAMMEAEELGQKIREQAANMDQALAKISGLKQTVKELQDENQQLSSEKCAFGRRLQDEVINCQNQNVRMTRMEKDLRDLHVELEQKVEIVRDLEEQLRNKDADLQQQHQLIEDLDVNKIRMQREIKQLGEKVDFLNSQLERLQFEIRAKDQILNDTRDILSKTQSELSQRSMEASELKDALDDRQRELDERVCMVTQLERTIHETHDEMSQRMARVDNTLRKYEAEIKERTTQIADLDDTLQLTQKQLMETKLQLQQQQQQSQRQQMELCATCAKLEELDNINRRQKQKLDERKVENVEVTQELRLTREQLQTQHAEFLTARRELVTTKREMERLSRELEETLVAQRSKDEDAARLSEELGASFARGAQAEARLIAETSRLQRELHELHQKYKVELELLASNRDEAQARYEEAMERLSFMSKQLTDNEQNHHHRLEQMRSELEYLHKELTSRKDLIRDANEAILVKDSAISRLKAHVLRMERMSQMQHQSSSDNSIYQTTAMLTSSSETHQSGGNYCTHGVASMRQTTYEKVPEELPVHSSTIQNTYSSAFKTLSSHQNSSHDNSNNSASLSTLHNTNGLPTNEARDGSHVIGDGCQDLFADHIIFPLEKSDFTDDVCKTEGYTASAVTVNTSAIERVSASCSTNKKEETASSSEEEMQSDSQKNGVSECGDSGSDGKVKSQKNKTKFVPANKVHFHALKSRKCKLNPGGSRPQNKNSVAGKGEKADYFHHHFDPETLIGTYKGNISIIEADKVQELQQQLQDNVLRQQEIERQLQSLDTNSQKCLQDHADVTRE